MSLFCLDGGWSEVNQNIVLTRPSFMSNSYPWFPNGNRFSTFIDTLSNSLTLPFLLLSQDKPKEKLIYLYSCGTHYDLAAFLMYNSYPKATATGYWYSVLPSYWYNILHRTPLFKTLTQKGKDTIALLLQKLWHASKFQYMLLVYFPN